MGLTSNDEFLNVIAHQARVAYATLQLQMCRDALQRWQADATREAWASDCPWIQDELAYYIQQVERWQDYLARLGEQPNMLGSSEMPSL